MTLTHTIRDKKSFDKIMNTEHNDAAGAKKVISGGIVANDFTSNSIFGTNSATAQEIGQFKTIRITNTNAAIQYIAFGVSGIAVPTVSTGFAIQPVLIQT